MKTTEPAPIVCGTDFSDAASAAAEIAAMIAYSLNAPLKLVFSRNLMELGTTPQTAEAIDQSYRERMKEQVHQLGRTGASIEGIISQGPPADAVIKFATKQNARLLVVGKYGSDTHWRMGSTAERIVEYSHVPTLVIQGPVPFKSWLRKDQLLKVFVGIDFSHASNAALEWVKMLHDIAPCNITVSHIDTPSEEEQRLGFPESWFVRGNPSEVQAILERDLRDRAAEILGPIEVNIAVHGGWGSKPSQIVNLAQKKESDLIIMGTHQRHGLKRIRHGSISHEVLRHADTSIACVPASSIPTKDSLKIPECKRILIAVDLNEPHEFILAKAYSIVDHGGKVLLFHNQKPNLSHALKKYDIPDETSDLKEQLYELIPGEAMERNILNKVEVTEESSNAEAICHAAERFNADVICMGSHTRPGFTAKMMGSVALTVLQKSRRPVFLIWPPSP